MKKAFKVKEWDQMKNTTFSKKLRGSFYGVVAVPTTSKIRAYPFFDHEFDMKREVAGTSDHRSTIIMNT
jgi:hypothetical protein